jgi:predicted esterase
LKLNKITIPKTANYYISGNKTNSIKNVWFVCHGYGQLAKFFIRNFNRLDKEENYIIAPEGLHRFYLNGFSGRVGASWMTKEEREDDIKDYNNFLKMVLKKELSEINFEKVNINLLGFSQGTTTISRFLFLNDIQADNLILWAGDLPNDIDYEKVKKFSQSNSIYFVTGNNDEFISLENFEAIIEKHEKEGIRISKIVFNGKHKIINEALVELQNKMHVEK